MHKKAFTIVELVGSLAILAMIVSITSAAIGGTMAKNKAKANIVKIANIAQTLEDYMLTNNLKVSNDGLPLYFSIDALAATDVLSDNPNDTIAEVRDYKSKPKILSDLKTTDTSPYYVKVVKAAGESEITYSIVSESNFKSITGISSMIGDTWGIEYSPNSTKIVRESERNTVKFRLVNNNASIFYNLFIKQIRYDLLTGMTGNNYAKTDVAVKTFKVDQNGVYSFSLNDKLSTGYYRLIMHLNTDFNSRVTASNELLLVVEDGVTKPLVTYTEDPAGIWYTTPKTFKAYGKRLISNEMADYVDISGFKYTSQYRYDNKMTIGGTTINQVAVPVSVADDKATITNASADGVYDLKVQSKISAAKNILGVDILGSIKTVVIKIDSTPPTVSISPAIANTTWTNTPFSISCNVIDDNSGLATNTFGKTGNLVVTTANTYQISATGNDEYTCVGADKAGNEVTRKYTVANIDPIKPVITSVTNGSGTWATQDVTLTVNATDAGGSGLNTSAYSFDNGATWQASNQKTVSTTQIVNIKVRDKALNISNLSAINVNIDRVAPPVPTSDVKYADGTNYDRVAAPWTNQNVTWNNFNATDTGGSTVNHYEYQTGCSGTWTDFGSSSYTYPLSGSSANLTYCMRAVDGAGNASPTSAAINVKIDKIAPGIPTFSVKDASGVDYDYTNAPWTNKNVTWNNFNATDTGGSTVNHYEYQTGCSGTWTDFGSSSYTYPLSGSSANLTYCMRAVDGAGNPSPTSAAIKIKIDKEALGTPTWDLKLADTNNYNGTWTKQSVTWNNFSTTNGGNAPIQYEYLLNCNTTNTWTDLASSYTYPLNNASYWDGQYCIRAVDSAGNVSASSAAINIKIDKIAPAIPTFSVKDASGAIYDYTNAPWTNQNVTWNNFNATDTGGSTVNHYEYQTGCSGTWTDFGSSSYTYPLSGSSANLTYCMRAVDGAGNASPTSAAINIKIDKTAPGIPTWDLKLADTNNYDGTIDNNWTKQDVTWNNFSATNTTASPVHYEYLSSCNTANTWTDLGSSYTYPLSTYESWDSSYCIRAVDGAGNISSQSGTVHISIDQIAPTGAAMSCTSTVWTNQDVTCTFSATDTGGSGIDHYRRDYDATMNSDDTEVYNYAAGDTTNTWSEERNTAVAIMAVDGAGNVSSQSTNVAIKIDKTKPVVTVTKCGNHANGESEVAAIGWAKINITDFSPTSGYAQYRYYNSPANAFSNPADDLVYPFIYSDNSYSRVSHPTSDKEFFLKFQGQASGTNTQRYHVGIRAYALDAAGNSNSWVYSDPNGNYYWNWEPTYSGTHASAHGADC